MDYVSAMTCNISRSISIQRFQAGDAQHFGRFEFFRENDDVPASWRSLGWCDESRKTNFLNGSTNGLRHGFPPVLYGPPVDFVRCQEGIDNCRNLGVGRVQQICGLNLDPAMTIGRDLWSGSLMRRPRAKYS